MKRGGFAAAALFVSGKWLVRPALLALTARPGAPFPRPLSKASHVSFSRPGGLTLPRIISEWGWG
jgi:hypothetical protein